MCVGGKKIIRFNLQDTVAAILGMMVNKHFHVNRDRRRPSLSNNNEWPDDILLGPTGLAPTLFEPQFKNLDPMWLLSITTR